MVLSVLCTTYTTYEIPNTLSYFVVHYWASSPSPLFCYTSTRVFKGKMNVQSISWLHGKMQCEVKSKVARPQPSSITPDPGFVVRCYSREGSGWRLAHSKSLKSHEKSRVTI